MNDDSHIPPEPPTTPPSIAPGIAPPPPPPTVPMAAPVEAPGLEEHVGPVNTDWQALWERRRRRKPGEDVSALTEVEVAFLRATRRGFEVRFVHRQSDPEQHLREVLRTHGMHLTDEEFEKGLQDVRDRAKGSDPVMDPAKYLQEIDTFIDGLVQNHHSAGSQFVFTEEAPEIRAGVIEWMCEDPEVLALITRRGIMAVGATLIGNLDLEHIVVPWRLIFLNCEFIASRPQSPEDALSYAALKLVSAEVQGLVLTGSHVGRVEAQRLVVKENLMFRAGPGGRFIAEDVVDLMGASVGGQMDCMGAYFKGGLNAQGLVTGGHLFLASADGHRFEADGPVVLSSAKIGAQLSMAGALLKGVPESFRGQGLSVGESAFLRNGQGSPFEAEGMIDLNQAKIGDQLSFTGSVLRGTPMSLNCQGITCGQIFLRSGEDTRFVAEGTIDLNQAKVDGQVSLAGSHLKGTPMSLQCQGAHAKSIFLISGFGQRLEAEGTVDLMGARVEGQVSLMESHLKGERSFSGQGLNVGGDLFMASSTTGRFEADGFVDLMGAKVGDQCTFSGAHFKATPISINCQGISVGGDLFFNNHSQGRFETEGMVDLIGAKIGDQFSLSGAHLKGSPVSLSAQGISTGGDVYMRSDFRHGTTQFVSEGSIFLTSAKISGHLQFSGAKLNGGEGTMDKWTSIRLAIKGKELPKKLALMATSMEVQGSMIMDKLNSLEFESDGVISLHATRIQERLVIDLPDDYAKRPPVIELTEAKADTFVLDGRVPPTENPQFFFNEFTFNAMNLNNFDGSPSGKNLGKLGLGYYWEAWQFWALLLGAAIGFGVGYLIFMHLMGALVCAVASSILFSWNFAAPYTLFRCKEVGLLEQMPRDKSQYSGSVYRKLENWLRNSAREDDADEIYLRQQKQEIQYASAGSRCRRQLIFFLSGHGIRPGRLWVAWIFLLAIGVGLFWKADSVLIAEEAGTGALRSLDSANFVHPDDGGLGRPSFAHEWDWSGPISMALRTSIPLLEHMAWPRAFPSHEEWRVIKITDEIQWPLHYDIAANVLNYANTLILAMLILTLSGWLKGKEKD